MTWSRNALARPGWTEQDRAQNVQLFPIVKTFLNAHFFSTVKLIQFTEFVTHTWNLPDLRDNTPFIWCQIKLLLLYKSEIPRTN